jgi:NADPH:quinone reductase-like Zn-dependent oxidoreductase
MLAKCAVLSKEAVVPAPGHLSIEKAATLPCAAVTVWVAVTRDRQMTAGGHGAHPGLWRCFSLCSAICPNLRCSSNRNDLDRENAKQLKALGASNVVNYSETPEWDLKARELTDGRGVDCVVETGDRDVADSLAVGGHVSLARA